MKETLSFRAVNTFVTVAECGGVLRAAHMLSYSQPAVTLQLQQLEERLGVKLFERRSRQMHLTAAGRQALEPARALLRSMATFENEANRIVHADAKPLIIGAIEPTASSRLPALVAKVRGAIADLCVKIEISGGDTIARAAEAGTIDVALTVPTQIAGWIYEPLFRERFVLLVRSDHRLAKQASVSLSQIPSENLIVTDETCVYRRTIERVFARYGVRGARIVESSSLASLPNAVLAGLGVAIAPKPVAIGHASELRVLSIRERPEVTIGVLRPKTIDHDSSLGRFIEYASALRAR